MVSPLLGWAPWLPRPRRGPAYQQEEEGDGATPPRWRMTRRPPPWASRSPAWPGRLWRRCGSRTCGPLPVHTLQRVRKVQPYGPKVTEYGKVQKEREREREIVLRHIGNSLHCTRVKLISWSGSWFMGLPVKISSITLKIVYRYPKDNKLCEMMKSGADLFWPSEHR